MTTALLAAAFTAAAGNADYGSGVFIVNEDWFGHNNSTLNYLDPGNADGDYWRYRVIQAENPGVELGCTSEFGAIYNGRFYIISKQAKDGGASVTGGRVTVADASTLKVLHQLVEIDPSGAQSDGRAFVGVNPSKGYVSTSAGVWVMDLDGFGITGRVTDPLDLTDGGYKAQTGTMVAVGGRVFAANVKAGVMVIDASTDQITDVVSLDVVAEGAGIGSIVESRDGKLWLSVAADKTGSGDALPFLVELDPATLSTRVVPVADGLLSPANSWFAWTPDAFCASAITNTLYWKGSESRWTGGAKVYKMDIDSGEQSLFVDLGADGADWKIYGCSMRVHPVTDQIYMSLYKSYGSQSYVVRRYGTDATLLGEYAMEPNYWFPALPVFPEASSSSSVAQADDAAAAAKGDLYDLCGRLVAAGVACPAAAGVKAGIYVYRTAAGAWKIAIP